MKAGSGTGNTVWPLSYWDCVNPTAPSTYEKNVAIAAAALPNGFRLSLGGAALPMYIFDQDASFNQFFIGSAMLTNANGVSLYTIPYAAAFESENGAANAPNLQGIMMHELGHMVDAFSIPTMPSGSSAFSPTSPGAQFDTISKMTGTWGPPQVPPLTPTCAQVYGTTTAANALCSSNSSISPWQIFLNSFIQSQPQNPEMFADAFQNCSGYTVGDLRDPALQSTYMKSLWTYMNSFWPGGCLRHE